MSAETVRRGQRTIKLDGMNSCACENTHQGVAHLRAESEFKSYVWFILGKAHLMKPNRQKPFSMTWSTFFMCKCASRTHLKGYTGHNVNHYPTIVESLRTTH
jgi:hypothetical protein